MKIQDELIAPYSIIIDADNFSVGQEREYEKKDGEKYTIQQGQTFHSSIESAIQKIIQLKLRDSEETINLEEFLKRYKFLNQEFFKKFGELKRLPKQIEE